MKKLLFFLLGFLLLTEIVAAVPPPTPDPRLEQIKARLAAVDLFGLQAPTGIIQASLIDFSGVGAGLAGCPPAGKARAFYDLGTNSWRVIDSTCADIIGGGGGGGAFPRLDQVTDPIVDRIFNTTSLTWGSTGGTFDISASQFIMPTAVGCTVSASNSLCRDTSNENIVVWFGEAGKIAVFPDSDTFTDGDIVGIKVTGGQITLQDLGPPAGGGGGGTPVTAIITDIQEGDTLCWDTSLATPNFVNCSAGVPINLQTGTTYIYDGVNDRGSAIISDNSGAQTYTLGAITDAGDFDSSWFIFQHNKNSGLVTVNTTAPSTFDDTGTQSTTIDEGQSCSFLTDTTGNGTIYPKCHEGRMTATAPIVFTRSPYGLAISCPTCGVGTGNLSGTLTAGKVPVASGALTLIDGGILDDLTHAARDDAGFDVNQAGAYLWWATNNTVTGTTVNKMACNDGTGKAIICPFASSTTNDPVGVAVAANGATPGTSGSTGICTLGFCSVIFDNTATAGHYAQSSTTVAGDLSDVGATVPTNGQSYWTVYTGNAGAGTAAIIRNLTSSELNAAGVSGGNGKSLQLKVNGTAITKPIGNLVDGTGITFALSTAANTTTITPTVTVSSGLSGMTAGQVAIAATANTVTSSKALIGTDTNIATADSLTGSTGAAVCKSSNGGLTTFGCAAGSVNHGLAFTIGQAGGTALTVASTTTAYLRIPFACTIQDYSLMIDAGTITVKFWKVATGTAIPTSANSISTSGVSISSGTAVRSTTLSDFTTTTIAANDMMAANVSAVATATFVTAVLSCQE